MSPRRIPGLIIAGTHSGCGKTQASLGLAAALTRQNLRVQGFKVGPDFIDPSHMTAVTGKAAHNLDGWMLSCDVVRELFTRHAKDADVCLIEGVMGLFDGASGTDETGSTAQMAKWLNLPVILVVNAASQARSAAALVRGFRDFDQDLRLAGILWTQVGGEKHVRLLTEALGANCPDLPCFGFLPRRPDLALPSRHLGLHTAQDVGWQQQHTAALADWMEQGADVFGLCSLARKRAAPCFSTPSLKSTAQSATIGLDSGGHPSPAPVRLAVARDRAFCFYYQENLNLLSYAGAELVFFSPLADTRLPENVHGLYLGGGYPELFAVRLAANASMRRSIRDAALADMPVYAECGGFLYLLAGLQDAQGVMHAMTGIFPFSAKMHPRFQALGYRQVTLTSDCLLGPANSMLRGHEFHYSRLDAPLDAEARFVYLTRDREGREHPEGFIRGNTLASYIHLHFSSRPQAAQSLVAACARWSKNHCRRHDDKTDGYPPESSRPGH